VGSPALPDKTTLMTISVLFVAVDALLVLNLVFESRQRQYESVILPFSLEGVGLPEI
jgi:hypothetical protein